LLTALKNLLIILSVSLGLLAPNSVYANSTCSRVALVNYQKILVDMSSRKKGEGLRHYLSKDPRSLALLDKYQDENKVNMYSAIIGTTATGLIIGGVMNNNDNKARQGMIISGIALFITNFLFSRTIESNNEKYLQKAVEVYNKSNLPRIYLNVDNSQGVDTDYQFMLNQGWSF
jgi:hypothetical protein